MQELKNNIRLKTFIPLTVHDGTGDTPLNGAAVDMREIDKDGSPMFDSALIQAVIGDVGANVDVATVLIQESDTSDFSAGNSVADGGAAVDVVAGDQTVIFEVKRSKRYIRAVLTVEVSGAADDIQIAVTGILSNWAKPFPTV